MPDEKEKERRIEQLEQIQKERGYYENTFIRTPEGRYCLAQIIDKSTLFRINPADRKPELAAFACWILEKCGILSDYNYPEMIDALTKTASIEDLLVAKRRLNHKEEQSV